MKIQFSKLGEELVANGIGWLSGLFSVDLLSYFFSIRSWKNGWGLFSRKATVSSATFEIMEWVLTAVIGFVVLLAVSHLVKLFFKNRRKQEELQQK